MPTLVMVMYAFRASLCNYTWHLIVEFLASQHKWKCHVHKHTHHHRVQVAANNVTGPGQVSTARGRTGNHSNRISHWWLI